MITITFHTDGDTESAAENFPTLASDPVALEVAQLALELATAVAEGQVVFDRMELTSPSGMDNAFDLGWLTGRLWHDGVLADGKVAAYAAEAARQLETGEWRSRY